MEHVGKIALSCASLFLFIFYFLFIFLVLMYFGNGHRRKVVDLLIYMILVFEDLVHDKPLHYDDKPLHYDDNPLHV